MAHLLNVDTLPSTNTKILTILDTSLWDCDTAINNLILEVKPPGRGYFSKRIVQRDFVSVWNCVNLELCCSDCDDCTENYSDLLDGVYTIKLSYNPNGKTVSEFRHLRNAKQKERYVQAICDLRSNRCGMSRKDYEKKEAELFKIRNYIEVAKYQVEECGNQNEGLELYEHVNDMLEKFIKSCSC